MSRATDPGQANRALSWAGVPLDLMLSACAEATEPEPTPAEDGGAYNVIDPVPTPVMPSAQTPTAGEWRPTRFEGARALNFASGGEEPSFRMYCDGRGGIILDRLQHESVGDIERMEIQVGNAVTRLAVNEVETQTPTLRTAIPFNHNLLERLRRPEGDLSVKAGDTPALLLPLSQSTAEFVEACERPGRSPPAPS